MSIGVAAITLGLIFLAELPDKSMVALIVLATRHRPLPVWCGASAAFLVHCALAATAGGLLARLPHTAVQIGVTVLFAGGAVYLLATGEPSAEKAGEQEAERIESGRRIVVTTFSVIAIGEIGDLTEVLTANLAARYHDTLSVFVGSAVGMLLVTGVGVVGGRALLRVLPLGVIRRIGGVALAALAVYSVVRLASG